MLTVHSGHWGNHGYPLWTVNCVVLCVCTVCGAEPALPFSLHVTHDAIDYLCAGDIPEQAQWEVCPVEEPSRLVEEQGGGVHSVWMLVPGHVVTAPAARNRRSRGTSRSISPVNRSWIA